MFPRSEGGPVILALISYFAFFFNNIFFLSNMTNWEDAEHFCNYPLCAKTYQVQVNTKSYLFLPRDSQNRTFGLFFVIFNLNIKQDCAFL